jgi:hypothetical protein
MTSVHSQILNHTLTGGHFIAVSTSAYTYLASDVEAAFPTASTTGFLNAAGAVFNFTTLGRAQSAINNNFDDGTALAVGQLYEDMGDRIVYSAQGQTVAIFAKVRLLNQAAYEGSETPLYTCIWVGEPGGDDEYDAMYVGVARL